MIIWSAYVPAILCYAIGALLAVIGLVKVFGFIATKADDRDPTNLLGGIAQAALGAVMIFEQSTFETLLQFIIGVILIYGTILLFLRAFALREIKGPFYISTLVFGCVTAILAIVVFVNPEGLLSFIHVVYGVSLILEGLFLILAMRRIKTLLPKVIEAEAEVKTAEPENADEPEA